VEPSDRKECKDEEAYSAAWVNSWKPAIFTSASQLVKSLFTTVVLHIGSVGAQNHASFARDWVEGFAVGRASEHIG
jgi:hypothetical protein